MPVCKGDNKLRGLRLEELSFGRVQNLGDWLAGNILTSFQNLDVGNWQRRVAKVSGKKLCVCCVP